MIKFVFVTLFFKSVSCFYASAQMYNAVIITEIMADPTPVNGLPEVEYLELYNRSGKVVSLKGWKLSLGSRIIVLPDSVMNPGSYAIVCQRNNTASMAGYGSVIGVNSFSLTNNGMTLALSTNKNQFVYSISYFDKWWVSDKRDGGFSLEMIDTDNPCGEEDNWLVSIDGRGGTPAQKNSVAGSKTDAAPPVVERINILENGELVVVFNERMDSLNAVSAAAIELSGHKISKRELELPEFHNLKLTPDPPLLVGQEYQLSVRNVADCAGNLLRESNHTIALPVNADSGDIVINEILFNPRPNGADFVELYNRSLKHINLKNWTLGNVKNGVLNVSVIISSEDIVIAPNSYLALTTEPRILKEQYSAARNQYFLEMMSFPVFPNTEGGVILRNDKSEVFDKFLYSEKMHYELLSNFEGVSLEKIDPGKRSDERSNWHSAAATAGYATPGYANSQVTPTIAEDDFIIEPEVFTPNNDGQDDFAMISYKQSVAGKVATIRIYNVAGKLVRNLIRNQLIGTNGNVHWDGTNEQGQLVTTGYYLFLIDTFDTAGNVHQFKKKVVVANKNR